MGTLHLLFTSQQPLSKRHVRASCFQGIRTKASTRGCPTVYTVEDACSVGAFTLRHLRPMDTLSPWRTFTKHALVSLTVLLWVSVRKAAEYLRVLVPVVSHKSSWALAFTSFFFFNFLLILCEFYIMHSKPTYFPVPCLCNTPPHKEKKKNEKNKKTLAMGAAVCQCVTQHSFCTHIFPCRCPLP